MFKEPPYWDSRGVKDGVRRFMSKDGMYALVEDINTGKVRLYKRDGENYKLMDTFMPITDMPEMSLDFLFIAYASFKQLNVIPMIIDVREKSIKILDILQ